MKTIIDLGCGVGNHLKKYIGTYHTVGIDLDTENIAICKKTYPTGEWHVGDITTFSLSSYTSIEKVMCTEVIEHVDDWKKVLENMSTVHTGAQLWLTTPYEKSEKKLLAVRPNYWNEIGHQHFFTGAEIRQTLEALGWTNINIKRRNAALYFELRRLFTKNAPCLRHTYYENILSLPERIFWQLFRADLFETRLKYLFPLWIFTLPLSKILDSFFGATLVVTADKK